MTNDSLNMYASRMVSCPQVNNVCDLSNDCVLISKLRMRVAVNPCYNRCFLLGHVCITPAPSCTLFPTIIMFLPDHLHTTHLDTVIRFPSFVISHNKSRCHLVEHFDRSLWLNASMSHIVKLFYDQALRLHRGHFQ